MDISAVLDRAADQIQARGWAKKTGWFPDCGEEGPICAEGAIRLAAQELSPETYLGWHRTAISHVADFLGLGTGLLSECEYLFAWNDGLAVDALEVIAVLRAAAATLPTTTTANSAHKGGAEVLLTLTHRFRDASE